jgi:uncharacterized membrane protein YgcG
MIVPPTFCLCCRVISCHLGLCLGTNLYLKKIEWIHAIVRGSRLSCVYDVAAAGPETWWIYYPSASGGNQSPIDVITEEVWFDPDLWHRPLHIGYGRTSGNASSADTPHSTGGSGDDSGDENDDGGGPGTGSGGGGPRDSMTLVNTGNTARINISNSSSCECTHERHLVYFFMH